MSLLDLPLELIEEILLLTDYDSTIALCQSHKKYNYLTNNHIFWEKKN